MKLLATIAAVLMLTVACGDVAPEEEIGTTLATSTSSATLTTLATPTKKSALATSTPTALETKVIQGLIILSGEIRHLGRELELIADETRGIGDLEYQLHQLNTYAQAHGETLESIQSDISYLEKTVYALEADVYTLERTCASRP